MAASHFRPEEGWYCHDKHPLWKDQGARKYLKVRVGTASGRPGRQQFVCPGQRCRKTFDKVQHLCSHYASCADLPELAGEAGDRLLRLALSTADGDLAELYVRLKDQPGALGDRLTAYMDSHMADLKAQNGHLQQKADQILETSRGTERHLQAMTTDLQQLRGQVEALHAEKASLQKRLECQHEAVMGGLDRNYQGIQNTQDNLVNLREDSMKMLISLRRVPLECAHCGLEYLHPVDQPLEHLQDGGVVDETLHVWTCRSDVCLGQNSGGFNLVLANDFKQRLQGSCMPADLVHRIAEADDCGPPNCLVEWDLPASCPCCLCRFDAGAHVPVSGCSASWKHAICRTCHERTLCVDAQRERCALCRGRWDPEAAVSRPTVHAHMLQVEEDKRRSAARKRPRQVLGPALSAEPEVQAAGEGAATAEHQRVT